MTTLTADDITIPPDPVGNRLIWLRDNITGFADAHDGAERAQIHAASVRRDLELRGANLSSRTERE